MKRAEIIDTARGHITIDRTAQHGRPENSFQRIAELWSTYLDVKIEPHEVAAMMVLLKIARFAKNPTHLDNSVDAVGYAAIMGELATEG